MFSLIGWNGEKTEERYVMMYGGWSETEKKGSSIYDGIK